MESNVKSKLTLIIDGNWLLMSRLFVLNHRIDDSAELAKEMELLMLQSINIVLKTFPDIDNIIFVSDGGSWRNKLAIPTFLTEEYKGNREPDDSVDWDVIWAEYEHLRNVLTETGINVCWETGIEGDDWCWYWSTKLNSEGTNVIIWSKDKDLTQLVNINKDKCFTVCWNKEGGVTCPEYEEDDMDFLFNPHFAQNENILSNVTKASCKILKINPKRIVVDKIVRGDAGDNIFPIILKQSTTNPNKSFRVLQKEIDEDLDILDDKCIINYISDLLSKKSYDGKVKKSLNDILEHFHYNTQLVYLDETQYPKNVLATMSTYDTYNCSKDINTCINIIRSTNNNLNSILEEI